MVERIKIFPVDATQEEKDNAWFIDAKGWSIDEEETYVDDDGIEKTRIVKLRLLQIPEGADASLYTYREYTRLEAEAAATSAINGRFKNFKGRQHMFSVETV